MDEKTKQLYNKIETEVKLDCKLIKASDEDATYLIHSTIDKTVKFVIRPLVEKLASKKELLSLWTEVYLMTLKDGSHTAKRMADESVKNFRETLKKEFGDGEAG